MPKNSDTPPSPPSDSSTWSKRIDEAIQRFEVAMQTQKEEVQQAFQKASKETSTALQLLKECNSEVHQKQIEGIHSKMADHSDANKRTSEWVDTKRTKPTSEATTVVLFSRCKVECGIPVNYEEFEKTLTTPAKPISELRSPPKNFQPSSPKRVCSQQEIADKTKYSNLFVRLKAIERFRKEPKKLV